MFSGVLLHGGPKIPYAEGLPGERPSPKVLSIDALVHLAQDVIYVLLIDALEEWDGYSSFV
jgi:hypothetical protein